MKRKLVVLNQVLAGEKRALRRWGAAAVWIVLLFAVVPRAQAVEKDPLSDLHERLDGMAPRKQIAYLDSLLGQGRDDARIHFFKGNAYYAVEQNDSAIVEFKRAVEIDEDYAKAYVNLGIVLDQARKTNEARAAYQRAIRINPEDVLAYCHLGFSYYASGKHAEAIRLYDKALEIDPNSAQAHYNLGLAFANAKIFKEAVLEWRKVAELDPGGTLGKMAAENVELIQQYMELGQ
jgi:tetratricopeptide (TPR) repeat protein